jgi:hypothetical protein
MYGGQLEPVLLPWAWAVAQLSAARNYWIATTRPDGRPHSRPVWGVVIDETVLFSTGSLAVGNLKRSPEICVHTESGNEVVILEGTAAPETDLAILRRVADAYSAKYGEPLDPENMPGFYAVSPRVGFGWIVNPTYADGGSVFHGTNTKWTF